MAEQEMLASPSLHEYMDSKAIYVQIRFVRNPKLG